MYIHLLFSVFLLSAKLCGGQVVQFGTCADVKTMQYFDLERFLGEWYEIERFPIWYEQFGKCAYKRLQYCAGHIEIEHIYVRDSIQFVLHMNSSYALGDEAVFEVQMNNIDPVGIPLLVISTDYTNYAVVYGCTNNEAMGIKYIQAWILSRTTSLPEATFLRAYHELNAIPYANVAYLEKVDHDEKACTYYWTAHIQAENITEPTKQEMLTKNKSFYYL